MMTFKHMAVSLLALVMSTGVASAYSFRDYPFHYSKNADGESVTVVGYEGGGGEVTIPSYAYQYFGGGSPMKEYKVTAIGDFAFCDCTGITKVTVNNNVESIGKGAFERCIGLTQVYIGGGVTSIGVGAFSYCDGLTSITVSGSNNYYYDNTCDAIIETKTNTLIAGCKNTTIPNGVKLIGDFAFYGCKGLTSVTIPESVKGIGKYAFYDCTGLTSVTIPNSLTSIGVSAFFNCTCLNKITSYIQKPFDLDESVFQYEQDGYTYTYKGAWLYVPYGTGDLYRARNGWKNFNIWEMDFTITDNMFKYPTSEGIEMTFTIVDEWEKTCQVGGAVPDKEDYYYFAVPENTTGTVTIPATVYDYKVIGIDAIAFKNRSAITEIIIPNSVTYINQKAFLDCTGITSVDIPNSVTSIGAEAFSGCRGLTKITIPESVMTIGVRALPSTLEEVYSLNPNPPSVSDNYLFDYYYLHEVYEDKTLYVPTPEKYSSCEPWKYFGQIRYIYDKDYYDNDVTTGVYYFQNVATGQYLTAGNAWGTQASLDDTGIDIKIEKGDYGYSLNTKIDNWGACYLNIDNGDVYCDQPQGYWFFVKTDDGAYALTMDGENYLSYGDNSGALTLVDYEGYSDYYDIFSQWRLVTKEERVAAMAGATKDSPVDATFLLPCANFGRNDTRIGQWEGAPSRGGANTNMNAEKFNTDYDVYQELTNIPNGWYKVKAQGFYREGADENYQITPAEELRRNGEEHLYAQFYANDVSTPVHSIFDGAGQCDYTGTESEWGYVPNSQADASAYFDKGLYEHEWEVLVTDGTLRIGVRKEAAVYRDWTCFDNFRLFYTGEYHEESQTLAQSITIDQNSLSFTEAGQTAQLTATVLPHNTTDKSVTWKSADWNVATVNANGLVTAVGNGTTEITATTQDGTNLTARCAVTVDIPTVIPETDYTTYVGTTAADWGTDALVGWAAPAVTTRDGRETALAERYHESADVTGIVLEQTVTGLPSGVYKAVLYANAYYTPGRNFDSDISDGQLDVVYIFANDSQQYIPVHIGTSVSVHGEYEIKTSVPDGTLRLGMMCEKTGTNWHSIQIKSLDRIGGIATGIETVDNGQWIKDNVVYDLQGRKINNNAKKGLYIINGKKVVK